MSKVFQRGQEASVSAFKPRVLISARKEVCAQLNDVKKEVLGGILL